MAMGTLVRTLQAWTPAAYCRRIGGLSRPIGAALPDAGDVRVTTLGMVNPSHLRT
jgi:hypothetical protein